jgi:hypothetical protein
LSSAASEWTSATGETAIVDTTMPFSASEVKGNIALVARDTAELKESRGSISSDVENMSKAGAVGAIVVVSDFKDPELYDTIWKYAFREFDIPVLLITSSDAARLLEHGSARIGGECLCGCLVSSPPKLTRVFPYP